MQTSAATNNFLAQLDLEDLILNFEQENEIVVKGSWSFSISVEMTNYAVINLPDTDIIFGSSEDGQQYTLHLSNICISAVGVTFSYQLLEESDLLDSLKDWNHWATVTLTDGTLVNAENGNGGGTLTEGEERYIWIVPVDTKDIVSLHIGDLELTVK